MFNIGPLELMVILIIALLVVGPKRLPEVGRSIGRALREFRRAQEEVQKTVQSALDEDPPSVPMRGTARAAPAGGTMDTREAASDGHADRPPGASEPSDMARHLGKGLAELKRARDEIQRSFRGEVDEGDDPPDGGPSAGKAG